MAGHVTYERNSTIWALNSLRQDALPRMLDDLGATSMDGIPETVCREVRSAHDKMVDLATIIPDKSFFRKSVWKTFEQYAEAYAKWNDVKGNDTASQKKRRDALSKVREKRNALATAIRKNQHIIDSEIDIKLVDDMYAALGGVVKKAPELFVELGNALTRYGKRRKDE